MFFRIALAVAATGVLGIASRAQEMPAEVTIIQLSTETPGAISAVSSTAEEGDPRVLELLKLKFDRHPAAILEARAVLAAGAGPADKPAEQFRLNVVAGRWDEVSAALKALPDNGGDQVYEYLLKDLDRAVVVNTPGQQQVAGPTPTPTLLPIQIADLADAAPGPLSEAQIKLLANLLKRTITSSGSIEPLLERLQKGATQLSGEDPLKREAAALLFLEANRHADALKFLPPLEPGKEMQSFSLLEKHVRTLFNLGRQENRPADIQRGWELNQRMLAVPDCPAEVRERAWRRFAEILRFLPEAQAKSALQELFSKQPQHGLAVLKAVTTQVLDDRANRETDVRKNNLQMQGWVAEALIPLLEGHRAEWLPAMDLMALNWMEEADYSKRLYQPPRNQSVQYDEFGNRIFFNGNQVPVQQGNSNQLPAIPAAEILAIAPGQNWINAMDRSLQPRALSLLAELHLKLEDDAKALSYVEQLAALQPKEASRIANELLRVWAKTHDPQRAMLQRQSGIVYYSSYGMMRQQGIPLTRALQQRNLEELSALLQRLRRLEIPSLEDSAVAGAFTAAHSQAEVFRQEAIELVLGKAEAVKPETLAELLQTMRQRLATQWRRPNVQQQAKTQRTDAQIDAEVLRGYELLASLIDKGLESRPKDWRLNLVQAAAWFDWAEFQYGKKVDLEIYVEKRERAFDAFARAAELYAASLPAEEKDETPLVYQQWLNANLGASDLAMATRQQEPGAGQLARIREAIAALPGAAAERHFNALAKAVSDTEAIPGHLKPGYMRAALSIVGDRPAASKVRDFVTYYDGLMHEIELNVRVDGDATVGHTQPFGVFFSVRHTAEIERENAGGFSKYLRNQTQNTYYSYYGIAPIDHRDELEKQMREKLSEGFEVLSITFHDEKVQSRGYGLAGWRETPLVYLLLKAKDASVDRIPSLRLDVDFLDGQGPVVLPIESAVQLIDARQASTPSRPVADLEITQILDERELEKEGKMAIEIKATGKGLVPEFGALLDFTPAGFKIDESIDSGPAIQRLDSEGDELAAASERSWLVKLSVDSSTQSGGRFEFPKPKASDLKVSYKRYADADLVEAPSELMLAGLPGRLAQGWWWTLGGGCVVAAAVFVGVRSKRAPDPAPEWTYSLPTHVTPFSALQLLRQMHADERLALSKDQRGELAQIIGEVEGYYFAHAPNGKPAPDLEKIGKQWVSKVQRPR